MNYSLPFVQPFGERYCWHGKVLAFDGATDDPVPDENPAEVIWAYQEEQGEWDGECACITILNDGRYATWETEWGPTGDGFCEDAYGGDANITVTSTLLGALIYGLSPEKRRLAGRELAIPHEGPTQ